MASDLACHALFWRHSCGLINTQRLDDSRSGVFQQLLTRQTLYSVVSNTSGSSAKLLSQVVEFLDVLVLVWLHLLNDPTSVGRVEVGSLALLHVNREGGGDATSDVASANRVETLVLGHGFSNLENSCVGLNKLEL
jgi:hypothetical protein